MSFFLEYELGKACNILVGELFNLKPKETVVITADTRSDSRVVHTTAQAALSRGAFPMVIWLAAPLGQGRAADPALPTSSLVGALNGADAWIDYSSDGLFYSTAYDRAVAENRKLRFMCLESMTTEVMVRCIGSVDFARLKTLLTAIAEMTSAAKSVRITTPSGQDLKFHNYPNQKVVLETGHADLPGVHMMGGQIGWRPNIESVSGTIVFDGSVSPFGVLREPVVLHVKNGRIVEVAGGKEAKQYDEWLRSWNHPQMLELAHVDYGFNPGATLSGHTIEDERVWGATEWGVGHVGEFFVPGSIEAPSHSDGICLSSSVWLDDVQLTERGRVVHPDLSALAGTLRR